MATIFEDVTDIGVTPAGSATLEQVKEDALSRGAAALADRMPDLVKGAGMRFPGQVKPTENPKEIMRDAFEATQAIYSSVKDGVARRDSGKPDIIAKAFNQQFVNQFPNFMSALTPSTMGMQQLVSELNSYLTQALGKNISLTSPVSSGLVPFNLVAPSRLIYPVYTPLRNKIPRVPAQGINVQGKLISGIPGSQTGPNGAPYDISMSEFPNGQSFSNWPLQLPGSGASENGFDLTIPFQKFGTTEAVSLFAQLAGQGFEDVSALANLFLLQKMMLGEEYMLIAGTAHNLSAPTVAATPRTAQSNETAVTGGTTSLYIVATATNYYGETVASAVQTVAFTAGDVYDVTITGSQGALQYNIYVGTGASDPGNSGHFLMVGQSTQAGVTKSGLQSASPVGAHLFTLQGALPTTGAVPPTTDTGTGASTRPEGIKSVLDGWAQTNSVYPNQSGTAQGGYVNLNAGTELRQTIVETALEQLWDGGLSTGGQAFRADPAELIAEGSDMARLSDDIRANTSTNYRVFFERGDLANLLGGGAVSEFVNPVTRNIVKLLVHPWLTQGTAFLMSYKLPQVWTNVANVWEWDLVQDYITIGWPTIDLTFRYSIVMYGGFVCWAPVYNAVISGLQVSDSKPYS